MPDLICLSHLRWDFVFQRPQHLLTRFAQHGRVFFLEEPVFDPIDSPYLELSPREDGLTVAVPHLPHGLAAEQVETIQRTLLDEMLQSQSITRYMSWYYTPMALSFSAHLAPLLTVYDCMDELSAFKFAPPRLQQLEQELFERADLVFTGGQSLYEAKREKHPSVHAFPSSIDKAHFAQALKPQQQPHDQASIPSPRLGFFGVIDERLDIVLLQALAEARPDWQLVLVGPVVKIDPALLPQLPNIHYLGGKSYNELPAYLSGWDVALLPFAINESTAFISPTKTPEYLAAGKPVVSTPIRDVVRPYGDEGLVHIAATASEFVDAVEKALTQIGDPVWSGKVEGFLKNMSWDETWRQMVQQIARVAQLKVK
ncbi:glycosyltransferase family 1 protein [Pontibacter sp. E15-1]|uniref:glycosyltransferase family 1 protein n=1 Tax=Pontibacter sp. E15-1 TaxID=2919918 RepID=UPI001F501032|nr:glycosyltransferase family 1 protein [Pontibacter sp. E15-1]MCJ8164189.1 glycosyltransferase family 1 protein [Pontibacter sp. E15-1]